MGTIERFGNTRGRAPLPTISRYVIHGGVVHLLGVTAEPTGDAALADPSGALERIDGLLRRAVPD